MTTEGAVLIIMSIVSFGLIGGLLLETLFKITKGHKPKEALMQVIKETLDPQ